MSVYTERSQPEDDVLLKIWKLVVWRVEKFGMRLVADEVVIDAGGVEHRMPASVDAVRAYARQTWDKDERRAAHLKAGRDHPLSKLTEEKAAAIRARRAAGETLQALADDFGVSAITIADVVRGRTWKVDGRSMAQAEDEADSIDRARGL